MLAGASPSLRAAGDSVWVLPSDAGGAHAEALSALQVAWRQSGRRGDLIVLESGQLPAEGHPGAVVTLGSGALRQVHSRAEMQADWARVPVLAALIPREAFTSIWRRPPAWVSAVYLDQPPERYMELIRRVFPKSTRVGVLLGPDGQAMRQVLAEEASERGLQLTPVTVGHPDMLYAALRTALADSDVLLVLPDSTVADAGALQRVLIAAYRQRIPVVAYSPALVRSGAALGLYASPAQVGRQVASMLKHAPQAANWPASRLADGFMIAANEQVCRSLGLDVPEPVALAELIRRQEGGR